MTEHKDRARFTVVCAEGGRMQMKLDLYFDEDRQTDRQAVRQADRLSDSQTVAIAFQGEKKQIDCLIS